MGLRYAAVLASVSASASTLVLAPPVVAQEAIAPYEDPPFTCEFHHFGEGEPPPIEGIPDDPLCVEYDKRDITAANGGAAAFLLAEPARFAVALPKCQYWQIDHWSIQVAQGQTAIASWDGSYWFDKGAGRGALIARNFAVGGQPADGHELADAIEPVSPELAAAIREYSAQGGGGGMTFTLPGGDPSCAAPQPEPAPTLTAGVIREEPHAERSLADTGRGAVATAVAAFVGVAMLRRRRRP